MPNGTDERAAGVPLRAMRTSNRHRTSAPTDEALRAAIARVTLARSGRKATADVVIFAALRLAEAAEAAAKDGRNPLAEEIERVEAERFPAAPGD